VKLVHISGQENETDKIAEFATNSMKKKKNSRDSCTGINKFMKG
jgi:hypothetical protein